MTESSELKHVDTYLHPESTLIPVLKNRLMSPVGYERDVRHYEFGLKGKNMGYGTGDCLGVFPHN